MRKLVILLVAGFLLSVATAASATTYSNTVAFTPADHNELTGTGTFTWQHPVTPDFQIPFDTVNSATLKITSKRAVGNNDIVSIINFGNLGKLGADGNSQYSTTFNLEDLGVFSAAWGSGQPLNLSLAYNATGNGNANSYSLTMLSSEFELDYTNATAPEPPTAPVPEPGTMFLLGCGMLSVAVCTKRRNNSAQ